VEVQKNCSVLDYHVLRKVGKCRYRKFSVLDYHCSAQGGRVQVQKIFFVLDYLVLRKVGV
jgi:hypothetical protein